MVKHPVVAARSLKTAWTSEPERSEEGPSGPEGDRVDSEVLDTARAVSIDAQKVSSSSVRSQPISLAEWIRTKTDTSGCAFDPPTIRWSPRSRATGRLTLPSSRDYCFTNPVSFS
nr:hypothetical protein GCM10025732_29900 [Glycomyces mayteni]